jgi:uncharacterized DUF497 family protein
VPVGDGDGQLTLEQRHLHASAVRPCEFDVVLAEQRVRIISVRRAREEEVAIYES